MRLYINILTNLQVNLQFTSYKVSQSYLSSFVSGLCFCLLTIENKVRHQRFMAFGSNTEL